jgi:hypothetical protein
MYHHPILIRCVPLDDVKAVKGSTWIGAAIVDLGLREFHRKNGRVLEQPHMSHSDPYGSA